MSLDIEFVKDRGFHDFPGYGFTWIAGLPICTMIALMIAGWGSLIPLAIFGILWWNFGKKCEYTMTTNPDPWYKWSYVLWINRKAGIGPMRIVETFKTLEEAEEYLKKNLGYQGDIKEEKFK
jgi:hypothetical protein